MHWMLMPLRRYADFRGRSRRREYWMFTLFNLLISVGFAVLGAVVGSGAALFTPSDVALDPSSGGAAGAFAAIGVLGLIQILLTLALLIPGLAVSVRRLHDIDRTGWWLAAPIVLYGVIIAAVVVGVMPMLTGASASAGPHIAAFVVAGIAGLALLVLGITLLVFACLDGTRGPNRYGADPKGEGQALDEVFR